MIPILTGLVVASLHILSAPDHLAVLSPISAEMASRGGRAGSYWGLVHGVSVVVIGGLLLLLRSLFDGPISATWAGFMVGLLLMGVGFWQMYRATRLEAHDHPHVHLQVSHEHIHVHREESQVHDHSAGAVAISHGALGPGNIGAVIPAVALPVTQAVIYLVTYLVSVVVVMAVFGYWLGHSRRRGDGPGWLTRAMSAAALATVVVGVTWLFGSWPFTA